jgi:hypothetical protein
MARNPSKEYQMKNADAKIDQAARTAKLKADHVIDGIADAASRAATKVGQHVHDAGVTVKNAGDKLKKLAD